MKKPTRKPDKTKAKLKEALTLARDATAWAKIMGEELVIEMDANAEAEAASLRVILRLIDGNAELAAENERIHEILAEYRARDADVALRGLATYEHQDRMIFGLKQEIQEVEQVLGAVLGYPWFKDDQKNFPGATESDGVCIGEHVAGTIAHEAATRIAKLEAARSPVESF